MVVVLVAVSCATLSIQAARIFTPSYGYIFGPLAVSSGFPIVACSRGYRWTPGAGYEPLPLLYSTNIYAPYPKAISADGKVIVGSVDNRACSWNANLQPSDLGFNGSAQAVSANGSVIAGYQ